MIAQHFSMRKGINMEKFRTISFHEHKFQYRSRVNNKHHILAESRGGKSTTRNLLTIEKFRHQALHYTFGLRTIKESADFLLKVKSFGNSMYGREAYYLLFGERTFKEASQLLYRLDSLKRHQTNNDYH